MDPASPNPSSKQNARSPFLTLFPSIMLTMFLAIVDQSIVATALPAIAGELGSAERVSWIVIGYLIAATIVAPVYGRLGDLLGRRRLLLVALAIFIAASVFCMLATSMTMLAIGRALQGLGGGGLMTLSQALVGEALPPRDRARYQGYLAGIGVVSNTFGPVAGGLLTEHFGWRSIFAINLPLGILAAVLALRLPHKSGSGEPFRFDYLGLVFFGTFVACVLLMLQQAQRPDLVDSNSAMLAFLIMVVSLVLFIVVERRAKTPLIPLHLIRRPAIWRSNLLAACHGSILVSLLTFVPIFLRVVHGASSGQMGVLLIPMTVCIGIGSLTTGRIVSRTGRTTILPSVGLIVAALGLAVFALASPHLSPATAAVLLGFNALFIGTVMAVVQVTVQTAAGPTMLGAAAASVQLSRSLGAAFGTALVAAILFASLGMMDSEAMNLFGAMLQRGPEVLSGLPDLRRSAIEGEFASAFRAAFLAIAGFAGLGCLLAWTIPIRRV